MSRLARVSLPAAIIALVAALIWLAFGHGFANYDTFYALVWGDEIAAGDEPDYGAPIPPTPHPLATLFGVLTASLGDGAETAAVIAGFLSLAAIAYLVFRLGQRWFNPWVGLLAAVLIVTREPVLSNGVRVYVDVPYIALVLVALLIEDRRPRAGWPVLAALGTAGLLRPEAWLFSAAYLLYLAYTEPARPEGRLAPIGFLLQRGRLLGLSVLAASAPVIWAGMDLWVTGDPLYSLTGTQETVETLERDTGLADAIVYGPRRLGEILREPVLLAAAGGGVLSLILLRRRGLARAEPPAAPPLGVAAAVLAVVAFLILATAGLAVITRYLMLAATIVVIFAAAGILGWLSLPPDHPWRRRWMAFGIATGLAVVVLSLPGVPSTQYDRLADLQDSIAIQQEIRDDLHELADEDIFRPDCEPVSVPNHRPVPLLALWLDRRPSEIISVQLEQRTSGYYVDPRNAEVEEEFTLDPNDPGELTAEVPLGLSPAARNDSWVVYSACPARTGG